MAKIDKDRALRILKIAEDAYPQRANLSLALGDEVDAALGEIRYLRDSGLIDIAIYESDEPVLGLARITKDGMNYLDASGGLRESLGEITVRIHPDSLQQILELVVLRSDLDPPQKQRFVDQIRELPAETTKHLALKVVDMALAHSGKLLPLLRSILGS